MKRWIIGILIISTIVCSFGCQRNDGKQTVNFYYVRDPYSYGKEDSVVVSEVHTITDGTDALRILEAYLEGPQDPTHASPFPSGTKIVEYAQNGDSLQITLSSHVATLSKAKQVLACACLARTVMEFTSAESVRFETDSDAFTRMDPVTIYKDSTLLYDNYTSTATTEP